MANNNTIKVAESILVDIMYQASRKDIPPTKRIEEVKKMVTLLLKESSVSEEMADIIEHYTK